MSVHSEQWLKQVEADHRRLYYTSNVSWDIRIGNLRLVHSYWDQNEIQHLLLWVLD